MPSRSTPAISVCTLAQSQPRPGDPGSKKAVVSQDVRLVIGGIGKRQPRDRVELVGAAHKARMGPRPDRLGWMRLDLVPEQVRPCGTMISLAVCSASLIQLFRGSAPTPAVVRTPAAARK